MKKESCKGFFGKIESYELHFVWGWQFVRKKSKIGGVRCLQLISVSGLLAPTAACKEHLEVRGETTVIMDR